MNNLPQAPGSVDPSEAYAMMLRNQPLEISHLQKVLRIDQILCETYKSHLEKKDEIEPVAFYRLMEMCLNEYEFADQKFGTVLKSSEIESLLDDTLMVPLSFFIGSSHLSSWLYYSNIAHQVRILIHYLNIARPKLQELAAEFYNLDLYTIQSEVTF